MKLTNIIPEKNFSEKSSQKALYVYESIIEWVSDDVYILDEKGNILEANQKACERLGYSKAELITENFINTIDESSRKVFTDFLKSITQKNNIRLEAIQTARNKSILTIEINASVLKLDEQSLIICSIKNISNREEPGNKQKDKYKAGDQDSELAQQELIEKESDILKTIFFNNLSLELRTPLNGILGFSELLINSENPKDIRQFAEIINKSGKSLLYIIEDLSLVSSIISKTVQIRPKSVLLNELLKDTKILIYEEHIFSENENISIRFNLPEKYFEYPISIDPSIYMLVVKKLARNAFKNTPKGIIEFGMQYSNNNEWVFYFKDTGVGIDPEKQDLVFRFFSQTDKSSAIEYGGIGTGLSISKSLIELSMGKMWFESTPGQGSTFYFSIPDNKAMPTEPKLLKKTEVQSTSHIFTSNELIGKSILIVEDNDYNFILMEAILSNSGATIIHSETGEEAIKLINSNDHIDLVLMDLILPGISGYSATSIIKKQKPNLPVIAQSALSQKEDIELALQAGCDDYIVKPYTNAEVLNKISSALL